MSVEEQHREATQMLEAMRAQHRRATELLKWIARALRQGPYTAQQIHDEISMFFREEVEHK